MVTTAPHSRQSHPIIILDSSFILPLLLPSLRRPDLNRLLDSLIPLVRDSIKSNPLLFHRTPSDFAFRSFSLGSWPPVLSDTTPPATKYNHARTTNRILPHSQPAPSLFPRSYLLADVFTHSPSTPAIILALPSQLSSTEVSSDQVRSSRPQSRNITTFILPHLLLRRTSSLAIALHSPLPFPSLVQVHGTIITWFASTFDVLRHYILLIIPFIPYNTHSHSHSHRVAPHHTNISLLLLLPCNRPP